MIEGAQDAARMPAFFDKHPDVDGFFCFGDTSASISTPRPPVAADYRQKFHDNHQVVAEVSAAFH